MYFKHDFAAAIARIFTISIFLVFLPAVVASPPRISSREVNSTGKAGLAWANGPYNNMAQYLTTGKVQWYYTWSPSSVGSQRIEFVPMLWGQNQVSAWESSINHTISSLKVTHVLGFNEPQQPGQSNMTPAEGASLWKAQIQPLKSRGILLGSPAPSSAPSGKQWLLDFLTECDGGCTLDFIAMHWYDINSTAFIEYVEDFHQTFQLPVWVTEWACQNNNVADEQCDLQDVVNFMNATQGFMDSTSWVERYAWFGAMENMQGVDNADALMTPSGQINTLGGQYIGALVPNISSNYQPGVVHGGDGASAAPAISEATRHSVPFCLTLLLAFYAFVFTML